jgi:hypothetical protein
MRDPKEGEGKGIATSAFLVNFFFKQNNFYFSQLSLCAIFGIFPDLVDLRALSTSWSVSPLQKTGMWQKLPLLLCEGGKLYLKTWLPF